MFKVGDKVICVDGYESQFFYLREGDTYTVSHVDCEGKVTLLESNALGWYPYRFVLASEYSGADNIKETTALDVQHGGGHYKGMKIQPVEFIHANNIGYMEGNAIKYLCRWQLKNGLEDLNKAKHYIELLIEMENARE